MGVKIDQAKPDPRLSSVAQIEAGAWRARPQPALHTGKAGQEARPTGKMFLVNPEPNAAAPAETLEPNLAWRRVQLARHPKRPHSLDYIGRLIADFDEIHGDRGFADDPAIVSGFGAFEGRPVLVVAEQKGRDTKQKLHRNFGMPKPEGYRKALRAMQMAAKFNRPIITLLDTPGAYPGIDAEERGQAEAIARNLREMARLTVPVLVVCIGEGGSGGALALGVGNIVLMLENAVYSVISPESCAAIIYRDSGKAEQAAAALRLTAEDLLGLGLIDNIIPEPPGGAQEDPDTAAENLRVALRDGLDQLAGLDARELVDHRYAKFRKMGNFFA
jgi:acetyl-CoA carboxylase carboxyl transferase subunit alpha